MNDPEPQEQNKRVGLHPAIVLFGVIIGLWLFIQAIIPKSKNIQPPQGNEVRSEQLALLLKEAESAPVPPVKVTAHVQGINALSLLVPQQTTDSLRTELRAEISSVESGLRAEISGLRAEVSENGERLARIEGFLGIGTPDARAAESPGETVRRN